MNDSKLKLLLFSISCWFKNMCLEYIELVLFSNIIPHYNQKYIQYRNGKFVIEQKKPFQLYYFLTFFSFVVVDVIFLIFIAAKKCFRKIFPNTHRRKHFFFLFGFNFIVIYEIN